MVKVTYLLLAHLFTHSKKHAIFQNFSQKIYGGQPGKKVPGAWKQNGREQQKGATASTVTP
jgi:hypothetical protein